MFALLTNALTPPRAPRPGSAVAKLTFDWSIELAQIKRMVADVRLWNRVVEAQSPLHYFAGASVWLHCVGVLRLSQSNAAWITYRDSPLTCCSKQPH